MEGNVEVRGRKRGRMRGRDRPGHLEEDVDKKDEDHIYQMRYNHFDWSTQN